MTQNRRRSSVLAFVASAVVQDRLESCHVFAVHLESPNSASSNFTTNLSCQQGKMHFMEQQTTRSSLFRSLLRRLFTLTRAARRIRARSFLAFLPFLSSVSFFSSNPRSRSSMRVARLDSIGGKISCQFAVLSRV
jgi:hypothetical protein